jgi:SsrA-binding protein
MSAKDKEAEGHNKLIAENRRARFDYFLEQTFEAGLSLTGTEVKALREGRANIAESYAASEGRDLVLINAYIPEYGPANQFNHDPRRPRKLLLHRREIDRMLGAVQRDGRTLVPTKLYFNDKGRVKLELCLAKGKKAHDKREVVAERDWKREQGRLMRDRG